MLTMILLISLTPIHRCQQYRSTSDKIARMSKTPTEITPVVAYRAYLWILQKEKTQKTITQYMPCHIGSETSIVKSPKHLNTREPLNNSEEDYFANFETPSKTSKEDFSKKGKTETLHARVQRAEPEE